MVIYICECSKKVKNIFIVRVFFILSSLFNWWMVSGMCADYRVKFILLKEGDLF